MRQEITARNATLGLGGTLFTTIFDPELVVFGNIDTRVTVRRIKLEVVAMLNISVLGAAQPLILGMGVYLADASIVGRNPNLVTEEDQETDWLYLTHLALPITATGFVSNTNVGPRGTLAWDPMAPDIKAMRKVDNQQVLGCAISVKQADPNDFTAPTITVGAMAVDTSVLYSRTMRR